jgi:hypothetical protein
MVLIDRVLSYTVRVCDTVRMTSARALFEAFPVAPKGEQTFLRLDRVTCGPCRELALGNSNGKIVAS